MEKQGAASGRPNGRRWGREGAGACAQTKARAGAAMGCGATTEDPSGAPSRDAGTALEGWDGMVDPLREWVVAQESMAAASIGKGGADASTLMLPAPALPLQRCEHDPADRTAADLPRNTCKGRLSVTAGAAPGAGGGGTWGGARGPHQRWA